MSTRREIEQQMVVDGRPVKVRLIHNPTVDDVVVAEARIVASTVEGMYVEDENRRVSRDVRDFLIRLNVER